MPMLDVDWFQCISAPFEGGRPLRGECTAERAPRSLPRRSGCGRALRRCAPRGGREGRPQRARRASRCRRPRSMRARGPGVTAGVRARLPRRRGSRADEHPRFALGGGGERHRRWREPARGGRVRTVDRVVGRGARLAARSRADAHRRPADSLVARGCARSSAGRRRGAQADRGARRDHHSSARGAEGAAR